MNVRRLERLIQILEDVAEREDGFDLGSWANPCGTTACAVGWACFDAQFQAEGLRMMNMESKRGLVHPTLETVRTAGYKDREVWPCFEGLEAWLAIMRFFDIRGGDAFKLFSPGNYTSRACRNPRAVIARIRALLAEAAPILPPVAIKALEPVS